MCIFGPRTEGGEGKSTLITPLPRAPSHLPSPPSFPPLPPSLPPFLEREQHSCDGPLCFSPAPPSPARGGGTAWESGWHRSLHPFRGPSSVSFLRATIFEIGWGLAAPAPARSPCPEGGPACLAWAEGGRAGVEGCLLGGFGATFVLVLVLLFVPTPTRTVFLTARTELILAPGRQPLLFPSTLLFLLEGDFLFSSLASPELRGRRF